MNIDEVDDIEALRKAAKMLETENLAMAKMITRLKRELFELKHGKAEQLELQMHIAELEEQLARRNKLLFGDKSEKMPKPKADGERKKQSGHGRREQPELEEVEQVHVGDFDEETCDLCGGHVYASEGFVQESEEIDIIERRFVIKKHRRQKYKCSCGSCIKTAPGPLKLFSGARYSVGFAVHVAMAKYCDHAPLERQVRGMKRDGLLVDSQTLWDQINALATHLQPAYERLQTYVLAQAVIGVDETHWKLMGETGKKKGGKGKRWQAWAICCPDAVHYSFEDNRGLDAAGKVLGGYTGTILTDGYVTYDALHARGGHFTQAYCWAHVRRKFLEIENQHPGKCEQVLDLIGQLYEVERFAKDKPPDKVLALREERARPILLAIQNWALEAEALPKSSLADAIRYMAERWDGLRVFLKDSAVGLDNNATERALRGIVILVSLCVSSSSAWNVESSVIPRITTRATRTLLTAA